MERAVGAAVGVLTTDLHARMLKWETQMSSLPSGVIYVRLQICFIWNRHGREILFFQDTTFPSNFRTSVVFLSIQLLIVRAQRAFLFCDGLKCC